MPALPEWEDLDHLSVQANSLMRDEFSLINMAHDCLVSGAYEDLVQVLDASIALDRRVENAHLIERFYL